MTRNDLCWCGSGKKYKKCHLEFDERLSEMKFNIFKGQVRPPKKIINNEADIEGIRQSGVINDGALDLMSTLVRPGVDTLSLNDAAHEYIVSHGGIPACLNYEGYPKSVCISVNNVVCHGIPSRRTILQEGDIVNIDITTILNGYYADASRMYLVGNVSPAAEHLAKVARECMELGIAAATAAKIILLWTSMNLLLASLELPPAAANILQNMLGASQLVTGLGGGLLCIYLMRRLQQAGRLR